MITAYATLKKAAASANHARGWLDDKRDGLIAKVYDEILGQVTRATSLFTAAAKSWCREGDFIFAPKPGPCYQQVAAFSVT